MKKELLELLRHAIDNIGSVRLLSGDAKDLEPLLDAIPDGSAKVEGVWVDDIEKRIERFSIELAVNAEIIHSILTAWAASRNISVDSEVDPGTPARNYELADRLGVGDIFGLAADRARNELD